MIPRQVLDQVMRCKAQMVVEIGGRYDLAPILEHHRAGNHVATVHAMGVETADQRLPLESLRLACAGFGTDELCVSLDVYNRRVAPILTGPQIREADPGSLAAAISEDVAADVSEALYLIHARADVDEISGLVVEYRYVETDDGLRVAYRGVCGPVPARGGELVDAVHSALRLSYDDPARAVWRHVTGGDDLPDPNLVGGMVARMWGHGVAVS